MNYIEEGASTPHIDIDDWISGYALYPINLVPGCHSEPGIMKKNGDVTVYVEFEEETIWDELQMIVMSTYDNCIKIDKDRNFTKDW